MSEAKLQRESGHRDALIATARDYFKDHVEELYEASITKPRDSVLCYIYNEYYTGPRIAFAQAYEIPDSSLRDFLEVVRDNRRASNKARRGLTEFAQTVMKYPYKYDKPPKNDRFRPQLLTDMFPQAKPSEERVKLVRHVLNLVSLVATFAFSDPLERTNGVFIWKPFYCIIPTHSESLRTRSHYAEYERSSGGRPGGATARRATPP